MYIHCLYTSSHFNYSHFTGNFGKGGLVEIRRTLIFSSTGFVFSPFRQLKRNESSAQKL